MQRALLAAGLFFLFVLFTGCAGDGSDIDGDGDGDQTGEGDGTGGDDAEPIDDAQDFCDLMAGAVCDKLMTCYSAQERLDMGAARDLATCLEEEQESCTPDTVCESGQTYSPDRAGACAVEYQAMTCEQLREPDLEPGPACSAVCQ